MPILKIYMVGGRPHLLTVQLAHEERLSQKSFGLLRRFTPRNDYLCKSLRAGGEAISLFYRRLKSVFKFDLWDSLSSCTS